MRQVQSDRILMIPEILKRYENIHQEHLNSTWNRGKSVREKRSQNQPKNLTEKLYPETLPNNLGWIIS